MAALTDQQIAAKLETVPTWKLEADELVKLFQFDDFLGSIRFVNVDDGKIAKEFVPVPIDARNIAGPSSPAPSTQSTQAALVPPVAKPSASSN